MNTATLSDAPRFLQFTDAGNKLPVIVNLAFVRSFAPIVEAGKEDSVYIDLGQDGGFYSAESMSQIQRALGVIGDPFGGRG